MMKALFENWKKSIILKFVRRKCPLKINIKMGLFGNSINKIGLLHVYSQMTIFHKDSTIFLEFFYATSQIKYSSCTIVNKNIRKNILNDAEIIFIDYKEKGYYIHKEYLALSNIIFSKYCYSICCINNT